MPKSALSKLSDKLETLTVPVEEPSEERKDVAQVDESEQRHFKKTKQQDSERHKASPLSRLRPTSEPADEERHIVSQEPEPAKGRASSPLNKLHRDTTDAQAADPADLPEHDPVEEPAKNPPDVDPLPGFDYKKFEESLEENDAETERRERKKAKRAAVASKVVSIVLAVACVYLCFLMYGVINTQYVYDQSGHVVAYRLTPAKLKEQKEFTELKKEYLQARNIYEQVLLLDYRVAMGLENPQLVAAEYNVLLEKQLNSLIIQVRAYEDACPSQYCQVAQSITLWAGGATSAGIRDDQTSLAAYCQFVSSALCDDNADAAANAINAQAACQNRFWKITQNLITIGSTIENADLTDVVKWSPEAFLREHVGAIGG